MQTYDMLTLSSIKRLIRDGASPAGIATWLRNNYRGIVKTPSSDTIALYIRHMAPILKAEAMLEVEAVHKAAEKDAEISGLLRDIDLSKIDVKKRKDAFEKIATAHLYRAEFIKQIQSSALTPQWEAAYREAIQAAQGAIKESVKFEEQGSLARYASILLDSLTKNLLPVVLLAYDDSHTKERRQIFLQSINNRLKKDLNIVKIADDAVTVLTTQKQKLLTEQIGKPLAQPIK